MPICQSHGAKNHTKIRPVTGFTGRILYYGSAARSADFMLFYRHAPYSTVIACIWQRTQSSAALKACSCVIAFSVRLMQSRISWPKKG